MKKGYFNDRGELFFEMDLMMIDSSIVTVDALLDTGFTDWNAQNTQDIEALGWSFLEKSEKQTASGAVKFNLYAGTVFFEGHKFAIKVIGGHKFTHALMGLQWLEQRRLIVDRKMDQLTLENVN